MFTDFQYGDELASDYGLYVVKFDSSSGGSETISSGSTLTFNTVKSVGQDISNKASTVLWRSFAGSVLDKV